MVFLLIGVYGYLFAFLANYQNVWVQPENYGWKPYILSNGIALQSEDLRKGLNWKIFEKASRTTRPLSAYVEILDTKFRAWAWQYMCPHPSLSITWFFTLFLSPLLLFKFLLKLKVRKNLAYGAIILYLTNPAVLSLLAMNFRPTKAMANWGIIVSLYWASLLYGEHNQRNKDKGPLFFPFLLFCLWMFISFFFDESVLVVYPAVLLLFPRLIFKDRAHAFCYAVLPPLTYYFYFYFFPYLHGLAGFAIPDLNQYEAVSEFKHFHNIGELINLMGWSDLFTNTKLLICDSLGLTNPFAAPSYYYPVLFVLNIIALGILLTKCVLFYRTRMYGAPSSRHFSISIVSSDEMLIWRSLLFMAVLAVYSNFLLHLVVNKVWGLYWYNTYWAIFWVMLFAIGLNGIHFGNRLLACICCVLACSSLYLFTYTNYAYRDYHYYQRFSLCLRDYFQGKIGRFSVVAPQNVNLKQKTIQIWEKQFKDRRIKNIPLELYYLIIELRMPQTTKIDPLWVKFDLEVVRQNIHLGPSYKILPNYTEMGSGIIRAALSTGKHFLPPVVWRRDAPQALNQIKYADVNHDGKDDALLFYRHTKLCVNFSTGTNFAKAVHLLNCGPHTLPEWVTIADVNGDAQNDIIYCIPYEYTSFSSKSTHIPIAVYVRLLSFGPELTYREIDPWVVYAKYDHLDQLQYADVNGDRKTDAIYIDESKNSMIWIGISTGESVTNPKAWSKPIAISPHQRHVQFADVNGDKMADLIYYDQKNQLLKVGISLGYGFADPVSALKLNDDVADAVFSTADVNGDGRMDIILFVKHHDRSRVWVSLSTDTHFSKPEIWLNLANRTVSRQIQYADVNGDGMADALIQTF